MRLIAMVLIAAVAIAGLVALVGSRLPKSHVARRQMVLAQAPEAVWSAITDFAGQAAWRTDLKSVERAPDRNGHEVWREISKRGDALPMETTEYVPPRRLVRTIADSSLAFGGRWVYELESVEQGTRITITEEGEVYHPIFRFISHYAMDMSATINGYLRALATRFGETPKIVPPA